MHIYVNIHKYIQKPYNYCMITLYVYIYMYINLCKGLLREQQTTKQPNIMYNYLQI